MEQRSTAQVKHITTYIGEVLWGTAFIFAAIVILSITFGSYVIDFFG